MSTQWLHTLELLVSAQRGHEEFWVAQPLSGHEEFWVVQLLSGHEEFWVAQPLSGHEEFWDAQPLSGHEEFWVVQPLSGHEEFWVAHRDAVTQCLLTFDGHVSVDRMRQLVEERLLVDG